MEPDTAIDDLVQKLGDIAHENYLGCDWDKLNDRYSYSYSNEVVNLLDSPQAKDAINALINEREKAAYRKGYDQGVADEAECKRLYPDEHEEKSNV